MSLFRTFSAAGRRSPHKTEREVKRACKAIRSIGGTGDYRSTPQVVSLANQVIAAARGRVAGSKLHLVGQRDPGPKPTYAEHPDEVAEAAAVAKKIVRLIESGTPPSEIAVLYRINAQSEVYEEALTEAGVAFQVRGGEGFFSRQEIRQALLAMLKPSNN